ncbi:MAG: hypothetical protein JF887_04680 [Candidatus Dormibacteraeota bacterium]|uniref:Uncharacterized protein n=1 Tax=Candidatus Amunia macphersoniae TaxID=3127014 RepID=A0A934KJ43_9BACT|nr:hypothetical protein [Candidatus Dormibacteraeota bacterium]
MNFTPNRPRSLIPPGTFAQLRWWSGRQRAVAASVAVVTFVLIGEVGQTLPNTAHGRSYAVEWWNYFTLVMSAVLLGLIAGTFVVRAGRRIAAGAGGGAVGTIGAIAMACPVCSPLAIPLLGTGGALTFLTPHRALISLASVLLLAVTLLLRLRASTRCAVAPASPPNVRTGATVASGT